MICEEFLPSLPLRRYIKSYIIIEDAEGFVLNRQMSIYPSGHLEMIINYGDRVDFEEPQTFVLKHENGYLGGQIMRPVYYRSRGHFKIFSIIFKPIGTFRFLRIPQQEFTHKKIDLDLIFGPESGRIIERLCEADGFQNKVSVIDRFFLDLLKNNVRDITLIAAASRIIQRSGGKIAIEELCKTLNTNIKTLERNFMHIVGIRPKEFSRVIRFNMAFNTINSESFCDINDVVHLCGYYDHSHFHNEFKRFTDLSPLEFFNKSNQDIERSFREQVKI